MSSFTETFKTKWPTYFFEVIVIILGILGAFALDNWNHYQQDRASERNYLIGMKKDLQKDLNYINEIKLNIEKYINHYEMIDSLHKINSLTSKNMKQYKLGLLRRSPNTFLPTPGNYKSMISEGKSGLILNREIFHLLQVIYEREYPRIEKVIDRVDARSDEIFWSHRKIKFSKMSLKILNESGYLADIKLHNNFIKYYRTRLREVKSRIDDVIILIDEEVQKN